MFLKLIFKKKKKRRNVHILAAMKTFGVVGPYTKHQFSHRRRALEDLLSQLPLPDGDE